MVTIDEIIATIYSEKIFTDGVHSKSLFAAKHHPYFAFDRGTWQIPEELAALILYLSDKQIRSFLNIGTFNGSTFKIISKFLRQLNQDVTCISIDPINHLKEKTENLIYQTATSFDFVGKRFDFVFIDGDHSYYWVKSDFLNVGRYAKYCAFHDTNNDYCPDVFQFWNEIKNKFQHEEFHFCKSKVFGIGVLKLNRVLL